MESGAANPGRSRLSGGPPSVFLRTFRVSGHRPVDAALRTATPTLGHCRSASVRYVSFAMDRLLDGGSGGPLYLQRPELAQMVAAALHDGEQRFHRYQLHAYVVMPNHVPMAGSLERADSLPRQWLARQPWPRLLARRKLRSPGSIRGPVRPHLVLHRAEPSPSGASLRGPAASVV